MKLDILSNPLHLKLRSSQNGRQIWDQIRARWVSFTPEEMVRNLFVRFLIKEKKVSKTRIAVEKEIKIGTQKKRFDILIFDSKTLPWMAIECKSPDIPLDDLVISQIVRYNKALDCKYLCIVNGLDYFMLQKAELERWKIIDIEAFQF